MTVDADRIMVFGADFHDEYDDEEYDYYASYDYGSAITLRPHAFEYNVSADAWSEIESEMPTARQDALCGVVTRGDSKLVVVGGGFGYWSTHDTVDILDVDTMTWRSGEYTTRRCHG